MAGIESTTSQPPPPPRQGTAVLSYLRDLHKWLRKTQALPGAGVRGTQLDGGRLFSVETRVSTVLYLDHPWKLYQETDDTPGLIVNMTPGIVSGVAVGGNPANITVTLSPLTVTDDATTIVWVKVSIELVVWTPYFKVWAISAAEVGSGASLPSDTLDIATMTNGDVHVQIGSIEAADGELVSITQNLFTPLNYNFPPILYGPETGVHVLVSNESVVDWIETVDDPPCPSPPEE
jgi:hypothetical protein